MLAAVRAASGSRSPTSAVKPLASPKMYVARRVARSSQVGTRNEAATAHVAIIAIHLAICETLSASDATPTKAAKTPRTGIHSQNCIGTVDFVAGDTKNEKSTA